MGHRARILAPTPGVVSPRLLEENVAKESRRVGRFATAHVAATAAVAATATTRERGCRRHGAAESDCESDHNLTQHHILRRECSASAMLR